MNTLHPSFRYPSLCYPATRPIRVTEPTFEQEPITLAEARDQVGLSSESDAHDAWLRTHVSVARDEVEHDTGVVCYTGAFNWNITDFPWDGDSIQIYGARPVTALTSIVYIATDGTPTTWSAVDTAYSLKNKSLVPSIYLNYGYVWPVVRGDQDGVTITLTAGYASVLAIPAKVKAAVRLKLHELWKLKMSEDTDSIVKGYERQVNLIRRDDYA